MDVDAAEAVEAAIAKQYIAAHEAAKKAIEEKDFTVRVTGPTHVQPGAPNKWQIETLRRGAIGRPAKLDVIVKDAKDKAAAGDKAAAIQLYKTVAAEKCMFSKKAKTANSELKKLGEENVGEFPAAGSPVFEPKASAAIVRVMKQGLIAENKAQYELADTLYTRARRMDPADPTRVSILREQMPLLAKRDWIAGAILWCYQDYKS